MKKVIAALIIACLLIPGMCFTSFAATEDTTIISLFDGTTDEWLDNSGGAKLSIDDIEGKTALMHEYANSSISLKRKFTVDWSGYNREDIYIIVDIYVGDEISETSKGTLKIKNGDSADADGNTTENNQLNYTVLDLGIEPGVWNHYELPLTDATPDGGDDFKIADWFCIWLNNNDLPVEVAIARLDIVKRTVVADPEPEVVETEAPVAETEAPAEAPVAEVTAPAPVTAAPQTSDALLCVLALVLTSGTAVLASKKK